MTQSRVLKVVGRLALTAILLCAVAISHAFAAPLGTVVNNVATIEYETGSVVIRLEAGPASFTIEAARTPAEITFHRYSPLSPDAVSVRLNGSDYQTGGGFSPTGPPVLATGAPIDASGLVGLVPTETFFAGETIFVEVADAGQNGDPDTIETIIATVSSGIGDAITLRLYETGPNTGVFFAYAQSVTDPVDTSDDRLSVDAEFELEARYQDPFDETEIVTDAAGVDPFGRVFDSSTGELLDGARVTVVDAATGEPAPVFGLDGVSAYPSSVVTGDTVTDASGQVYDLGPGEFRFPVMFPGTYTLLIEPPGTYTAPSALPAEAFEDLDNAPFDISPASYGESFVLDGTANVSVDIPVDPETDIVVQKTASTTVAAIGDFVRYEVTVENRADNPVRGALRDDLPRGFRYQKGSARRAGAKIEDPTIAGGRALTFDLGLLPAGETVRFAYVVEIAAGARKGEAINRAFFTDAGGRVASNIGEAAIEIGDDFLRDSLTIVGRVAHSACAPEDPWPRAISDGEGVAGVRLYLETGAYVVTDEEGLYHFENVEVKTHVVQVDETTLPKGFDLVQCEDNTRFAGRANSQFVDAQGGAVWRANFYLKKNAEYEEPGAVAQEVFSDAKEHLAFDKAWLETQDGALEWAYPAPGTTPTIRSVNLGLKHEGGTKAKLLINGEPADPLFFDGRDVTLNRKVALSHWRGVHLLDGDNVFEAVITDMKGEEITRISRTISFVTEIKRAIIVEEGSVLVADGRTNPALAIRVTDAGGRPVHRGKVIDVVVEPPYRAKSAATFEEETPLDAPNAAVTKATVGLDGVAVVELQPTPQTGRARIAVALDGGRQEEVSAYLKPARRDWIVVGLAEGALAGEKISGDDPALPTGRELLEDGRVAAFAKGSVGDWLITAAVDTDKSRGDEDDQLLDAIDPDERYPLYGDRTDQDFEAQSRYPVYLKAEKDGFRAELGDYDTGLNEARLARYTRRLTGVETEYESDKFSFTGFAAETNQSFRKEEIAADGTSGPYRLAAAPLVRNSETITIESRNRFRPDEIAAVRPMVRYLDYDIDFETGEIVFRLPVGATDADLNNNVIVVDYETSVRGEREIVAGGRAAMRFNDGRGEVGVNFIHEEGTASALPGQEIGGADLAGVDFVYAVTDETQLRVEYAATRRETVDGRETDDAVLFDLRHTSANLEANAFFSEAGEDFGLGQQTSATLGARRYGARARYRFDEFTDGESQTRGVRYVEGEAYREENLATGASRTVAEIAVGQTSNRTSGEIGLRRVVEKPAEGETRKALLLTSEARHTFENIGLTTRARREQAIGGDNASALFPQRTSFGVDQRLFDAVTLSATHEILKGDEQESSTTNVGVTANLWKGGTLSAAGDLLSQDSAQRIGATFGVDQEVKLSDKWRGSFGVTAEKICVMTTWSNRLTTSFRIRRFRLRTCRSTTRRFISAQAIAARRPPVLCAVNSESRRTASAIPASPAPRAKSTTSSPLPAQLDIHRKTKT